MTEEINPLHSQPPYVFGEVSNTNLSIDPDVDHLKTPLILPWNGISEDETSSRSKRTRRDTYAFNPASSPVQLDIVAQVHGRLSRRLASMSTSDLNSLSSDVFMMDQLNWLRCYFSSNPEALRYIDGDLRTRSLCLQWNLHNDTDSVLLNDLLAVGFPGLTNGVNAASPAILVSRINDGGAGTWDAFHVLPLGKIFGASDGMRLEAAWGRATCRPLYQKSDDYRRGYASGSTGLPSEVDAIKSSLLWAYNQIRSEGTDKAIRSITASDRYDQLERDMQTRFGFSQGEFERTPQDPEILSTLIRLQGAVAYLAYDHAVLTGSNPQLDPAGEGYVGYMNLRKMFTALLAGLRRYLATSKSNMSEVKAQALTAGSLLDTVNANMKNLLDEEVRKFVARFSAKYPRIPLTEGSTFLIRSVSVPLIAPVGPMGAVSYPIGSNPYTTETMSLSDMLMKPIPRGEWYYPDGRSVSNRDKACIVDEITKTRYDMDTEIPFRFDQVLRSKQADYTRVLGSALELHANQFVNNEANPAHQRELVEKFKKGNKPAYKCAFKGHTVYGSVFIPYSDDDGQTEYGSDLSKNGLLYSPYNGFVWLETDRFTDTQYVAMRNGLSIQGKTELDAAMEVKSLPSTGLIYPGYMGMGGYVQIPPISVGPLRYFDAQVDSEHLTFNYNTTPLYLTNSISEYFDEVFSASHVSLQDRWDEIRDHLMLAVSILNIAAIPFPYLGLALIAGNITIAIVTLADRTSSTGDRAWAIADLVLEPLGAVGDILTLSTKATKMLTDIAQTSGANSPAFTRKLIELAQVELIKQPKRVNDKIVGIVGRIGDNSDYPSFATATRTPNVPSNGMCRGLAFKDAISRLNGSPIDNLTTEFSQNLSLADDVQVLHCTQPVVLNRSQVLSSREARLATRKAVGASERGGNSVSLDEEMTFSRANAEILVQLAKHDELSMVIGTRTHTVSLSKSGIGANAKLTLFDSAADQLFEWPLGNEKQNVADILNYIASNYDKGVSRQLGDNPLLLTVLTKSPESRHIYVPKAGMESLMAAVNQLDLDVSQGRLIQPIMVKGPAEKAALQADLVTLAATKPELKPLLDSLEIEELQPNRLSALSIENSALTVVGQSDVPASNIVTDLSALPKGYIDIRYLDARRAANDSMSVNHRTRQFSSENLVIVGGTDIKATPSEALATAMENAGYSHTRVRDGKLKFPLDRTREEWNIIGLEQRGRAKNVIAQNSNQSGDSNGVALALRDNRERKLLYLTSPRDHRGHKTLRYYLDMGVEREQICVININPRDEQLPDDIQALGKVIILNSQPGIEVEPNQVYHALTGSLGKNKSQFIGKLEGYTEFEQELKAFGVDEPSDVGQSTRHIAQDIAGGKSQATKNFFTRTWNAYQNQAVNAEVTQQVDEVYRQIKDSITREGWKGVSLVWSRGLNGEEFSKLRSLGDRNSLSVSSPMEQVEEVKSFKLLDEQKRNPHHLMTPQLYETLKEVNTKKKMLTIPIGDPIEYSPYHSALTGATKQYYLNSDVSDALNLIQYWNKSSELRDANHGKFNQGVFLQQLFKKLSEDGIPLQQVGLRSGEMEKGAYMGIPTLYLEEHNAAKGSARLLPVTRGGEVAREADESQRVKDDALKIAQKTKQIQKFNDDILKNKSKLSTIRAKDSNNQRGIAGIEKNIEKLEANKLTLEAEVAQLEESIKAYQLDASFSAPHRVVNEGDGLGGLPYFIRENLENYVGLYAAQNPADMQLLRLWLRDIASQGADTLFESVPEHIAKGTMTPFEVDILGNYIEDVIANFSAYRTKYLP
ncbi:hypothetical protein GCM10007938_30760 [Vibrio zhanjiangensis]|uniref:Uncharacterized protein n=1 Tax=Vibrio zhanjiangensis TaxID=1046128 RepID=A0ABQ6F2U1_9VIBR|nr:hypothetical protein [Vibrio zhanjiangensis]GLT19294.1 hypothetical protein GCM10007938_30760 [Vibrio zhanjiangensis]